MIFSIAESYKIYLNKLTIAILIVDSLLLFMNMINLTLVEVRCERILAYQRILGAIKKGKRIYSSLMVENYKKAGCF